jgi:hypothetical protein
MLKRNVRLEADLVDQLFNSSEKRLARALLLLARYGKEGQPETTLVLGKRVNLLLNNLVTGSENLPSRRTSDVDVLNGTVSAGARG